MLNWSGFWLAESPDSALPVTGLVTVWQLGRARECWLLRYATLINRCLIRRVPDIMSRPDTSSSLSVSFQAFYCFLCFKWCSVTLMDIQNKINISTKLFKRALGSFGSLIHLKILMLKVSSIKIWHDDLKLWCAISIVASKGLFIIDDSFLYILADIGWYLGW